MRTDLSANVTAALKSDNGVNLLTRLRLYRSRNWFVAGDLATTYAAAFADALGTISATPVPQDMKYDPRRALYLSVMNRASDNNIYMGTSARAVFAPTITGGATTMYTTVGARPSVAWNETTIWLFFHNDLTDTIRRAQVNVTKLLAGDTDCITANASIISFKSPCAIHAIDEKTLIVLWIDEGGVRVTMYYLSGTSWVEDEWQGRFEHPENVFDGTVDADIYALNYSAAVRNGGTFATGDTFVYYTMPDGNVLGTQRMAGGTWTDSFEAVPADLSNFACANAIVSSNGRIHLAGNFQRQDIEESKFTSTHVYALDLASDEGRTFSLDRTTVVAADTGSIRPFVAERVPVSGFANVTYGDANRYYSGNARYSLAGGDAENYIIDDAISVSGGINTGWTVRLKNADERQSSQALMTVGSYALLQFGVYYAGADEYFDEQLCVITGFTEEFQDGSRVFILKLSPDSKYKADVMTHPFDIEIKSKQSGSEYFGEGDTDFQTLFRADQDGFLLTPFMVDFWSDSGCEPGENATTAETEYTTADLTSVVRNYPTIDALPFDIYMYGWSRSGKPTPYTGGTGDQPTDLAAPNDQIQCKLYVTHPDDTTAEITVTDISALGTYDQFPQTWYATNAGDYPVILEGDAADGFEVGDKITKVGFIFSNTVAPNNAQTVFYPCRVEIPDVSMQLGVDDTVWEPVTVAGTATQLCSIELVDFTGGVGVTATFSNETGLLEYSGPNGTRVTMVFRMINCLNYTAPGGSTPKTGVKINNTGVSSVTLGHYDPQTVDAGYTPIYSGNSTGIAIAPGVTSYVGVDTTPATWVGDTVLDGYFCLRTPTGVTTGSVTMEGFYVRENAADPPEDYIEFWTNADTCGTCTVVPGEDEVGQELQRIGIPTVYFSNKPYHSFNFEAAAKFRLAGDDSTNAYGGVVGLASSADDYILARTNTTTVELYKVRSGLLTLLANAANAFDTDRGWIALKHQDGVFTVRTRDSDNLWTDPLITYEWTEADGALATDKDILHVGIYGLRDSPWARITSYDAAAGIRTGVLPACVHWDARDFPATGNIRMNGNVYSYSSLVLEGFGIEGPYMGQNTGGRYNYTNGGESYEGKAAEFSRFEWLDNSANSDNYDEYLQAYSSGVAWEMDYGGAPDNGGTDFRPFIFTDGVQVNLKNRGRFFSEQIGGDLVGNSVKAWLTGGFKGLRLVAGDTEQTHAEGTIAFLDNDAVVIFLGFLASSGDEDAVLADMITKIAAIADASVSFPGDISDSSQSLSTVEWVINP